MCGITSAGYRTKVSIRLNIDVEYLCVLYLLMHKFFMSLESSWPVNGEFPFDFFIGQVCNVIIRFFLTDFISLCGCTHI